MLKCALPLKRGGLFLLPLARPGGSWSWQPTHLLGPRYGLRRAPVDAGAAARAPARSARRAPRREGTPADRAAGPDRHRRCQDDAATSVTGESRRFRSSTCALDRGAGPLRVAGRLTAARARGGSSPRPHATARSAARRLVAVAMLPASWPAAARPPSPLPARPRGRRAAHRGRGRAGSSPRRRRQRASVGPAAPRSPSPTPRATCSASSAWTARRRTSRVQRRRRRDGLEGSDLSLRRRRRRQGGERARCSRAAATRSRRARRASSCSSTSRPASTSRPGGPLFGVQFSSLPLQRRQAPRLAARASSGDPGGVPLYKNGRVVGGVGVEGDGVYGDRRRSRDDAPARGAGRARPGQRGFEPPELDPRRARSSPTASACLRRTRGRAGRERRARRRGPGSSCRGRRRRRPRRRRTLGGVAGQRRSALPDARRRGPDRGRRRPRS